MQEVSITKEVTQEAQIFTKDVIASQALKEKVFSTLSNKNIYSAIIEGLARGFTPQDFLAKKVYAIPFKDSYSLVSSIEDARTKASQTGCYAGSSAPIFTFSDDGKIDSCTVSVSKFVRNVVCEFTATVYFDEYTTNRNLWVTKPRTMIAKVAEMHALRKAFPDTVKLYDEAELEKGNVRQFVPNSPQEVTISVDEPLVVREEKSVSMDQLGAENGVPQGYSEDIPVITQE